jgi:PAS domain S-box-containing protein
MNSNEAYLGGPDLTPEDDLEDLLQQFLHDLSAGRAAAGEEPAPVNLQLLASLQQALDQLQEQLRPEQKEEDGELRDSGFEQSGSPVMETQPSTDEAQDSQTILDAILEFLPVGLVVAEGKEGKVRQVSEYGKSFLTSVTPEFEGASWEEFLTGWQAFHTDGSTPADLEELPPHRVLRSGERIKDEEWIFQGEDGLNAFIVCNGGPILDAEGKIAGGIMTWQDVTGHKHSQERARESEAQARARAAELEAVLDAVPATVWIAKDPESRVVTGNRHSYEMLRMPYGVNPSKTAPEGEVPVHFRVFQDGVELTPHELPLQVSAAQGIEIRDFEEDIVFDDGAVRHVVGNVTPLLDENGRPGGAVAAFVDITARVQAERALRESESRYRNLFESMVEAFSLNELLYDEAGRPFDFRLLDVNPAFERITGIPREVVVGKTRKEIRANASPDLVEQVARVVQTGEPAQFEYYSESIDKHLEMRVYHTGESHFAILSVDITERKQAEEALYRAQEMLEDRVKERTRELAETNLLLSETNEQLLLEIAERQRAEAARRASQALFERLFQSAPDPIVLLDDRDRILAMNLQAISRFGYSVEELAGEPFESLLPEYLHIPFASWRNRMDDALDPRPVLLDLDLYAQPKNGERIPVDITISTFQLEGQRQAICLLHDIAPRKQIEDALRQSEARFRAIFEQSPVGIQLLDLEGNNLEWNARFQEMVGYEKEELRQMTYLDYTYPEDVERNKKLFENLVRGQFDQYSLEKRFVLKDGQVAWRRLFVALTRDVEGLPLFILKIVEDIDEQKRIEADLAEVQRRLIDSGETERILIARELHDGPLQEIFALTYNLSALGDALETAEHKAELRSIQGKLIEVNQVLRGIMRELRPPALSPFGLEKAILDHADQLQHRFTDIKVHLDLMPDGASLPERVRLALFRIYQAALSNVTRHAQASEVAVRLLLAEKEVTLEIRDDGVGFEVPERWIGLVRQGQYGLVGAAERAEAMGGRLQVSSQPGGGTLIRVVVPRGMDL